MTQLSESHVKYRESSVSYKEDDQTKTKNIIVVDEIHQLTGIGNINIESSDKTNRKIIYDKYNNSGKLIEYTMMDADKVVYLWSYNYQYPIAEIKNATYTQVRDALGGQTVMDNIAKSTVLSDADNAKINNLRTNAGLAGAHITTYTYKPLVGILTATDPAGLTTTYEYDTFGRLIRIKDPAGKIIQSYNYHYQNQ